MSLRLDGPEGRHAYRPHLLLPTRCPCHVLVRNGPTPLAKRDAPVLDQRPMARACRWLFAKGGMSVIVLLALMITPCIAWALGGR